jgi:hypothetical protein
MKAFPVQDAFATNTDRGMDLRDYFAAQAMQSLLWNPDANLDSKDDVCTAAYEYADEMMKARTK